MFIANGFRLDSFPFVRYSRLLLPQFRGKDRKDVTKPTYFLNKISANLSKIRGGENGPGKTDFRGAACRLRSRSDREACFVGCADGFGRRIFEVNGGDFPMSLTRLIESGKLACRPT